MSKAYFTTTLICSAALAVLISFSVRSSLASQPQPTANPALPPGSSAILLWQQIRSANLPGVKVYRCAVPGGWLVTTKAEGTVPFGTGMSFVPDVDHSWKMEVIPERAMYSPNPTFSSEPKKSKSSSPKIYPPK